MTLQKKAVLILFVATVGLILALYFGLSSILTKSFARLENKSAMQNSQRAYNALNNEVRNINKLLIDWSEWDDSYEFVNNQNHAYIRSNLTETSFIENQLSLILYYNNENQIVWEQGYDLLNEEYIPISDDLKKFIFDNKSVLLNQEDTESNANGIVVLPEGPYILCSHPIITSESEGPVRGRLIFGRHIDSGLVESLSNLTKLKISINRIEEFDFDTMLLINDYSDAETPDIIFEATSQNLITSYIKIRDIINKPVLIMKIVFPRDIYKQGRTTINYFVLLLSGIGILFAFLIIFFIQKLIISRLHQFTDTVNEIAYHTDFTGRIDVHGNDELSILGSNINQMMVKLEESQKQIKEAKDQLEIRVKQRTRDLADANIALESEIKIRKNSESKIRESLREKDVLLKEIHHRVKNNLQVISSLLFHQSQFADVNAKELFQESQSRVKSLALIHEMLYTSKDFSKIDFYEYIKSLTISIKNMYNSSKLSAIGINIDIQNISLDIQKALPCGLIVNELVTNSLKHAFPNGGKGNISIHMAKEDNGKNRLRISDDGIGLPKDLDISKIKSLGLKLAMRLSEQLDGTFDINSSNNGTQFDVTFDDDQYDNHQEAV